MANQRLKYYEILNRIGGGGMATVFRARDVRNGATVAVKMMHPHLAENPQYIERFRREAQTTMALQSPHVVRIVDVGQEGVTHFLVMEYVAGITVHQLVQERGALSVSQALDIAAQVAEALDAAQRHGIVHRDIKPQNIMITADGIVKVMDFGIARSSDMSTMTQTGLFMGSPHYASPEQAQGQRLDIRSDIYALGITLYQMLTGIVPFNADTPWAIMQQHVTREPVPIRQLRMDIPPEVEAIVARALAKNSAERYQTPAEMVNAIRTVQSPSTAMTQELATIVTMHPPVASTVPPAPAAQRERPRWFVGAVAGAIVVVLALVALFVLLQREPALREAQVTQAAIPVTSTTAIPPVETVPPTVTSVTSPTPTNPPPIVLSLPAARLLAPEDGWNNSSEEMQFAWEGVADKVRYQIETRSELPDQLEWRIWPVEPAGQAFVLTVVYSRHKEYFRQAGTVYHWRVVALDETGAVGSYSAERTFIFNPPVTPTLTSTLQASATTTPTRARATMTPSATLVTATPTLQPTFTPTTRPTSEPGSTSTDTPTPRPSDTPTPRPSDTPTTRPTDTPTPPPYP